MDQQDFQLLRRFHVQNFPHITHELVASHLADLSMKGEISMPNELTSLSVIRDDSSYYIVYNGETKNVTVTQKATNDAMDIPAGDLGELIGNLLSAEASARGAYYSDRLLSTEAGE